VRDQVLLLPNYACVAVHNFEAITPVHLDGRIAPAQVDSLAREDIPPATS
jgi:hypothetical protein